MTLFFLLIQDPVLIAIISLVSALFGSGGVYAWFKLGPERKQIVVNASHEAVIIHSDVLKDIKAQYDSLSDELGQVKMELVQVERVHQECEKKTQELQSSMFFLQRDLDRHGRLSELARRKSHVAIHAIGGYELLIDEILAEMRNHNIPIRSDLRPYKLRAAFQAEMDKLETLEAAITETSVKNPPENEGAGI